MSRVTKCLLIIVGLVLLESGVLLAAGTANEELVEQLRSDIDMILGISGVIQTALIATIGILWNSLRSSQREFIKTLKQLKDDTHAG